MNETAGERRDYVIPEFFTNPILRPYLRNVLNWQGYVRLLGLPHLHEKPDIVIEHPKKEEKRMKRNTTIIAGLLLTWVWTAVPATEPAPREDATVYRSDRPEAYLQSPDGSHAGADGTDIMPHASLGSDQGEPPPRRYEAVAEAVVSDRLDRLSALRAAYNLARARVVSQALDLPPPGVMMIRTKADAAWVFTGLLDAGLPVDQRFEWINPKEGADEEEKIGVRLTARVVPIGNHLRPAMNAWLDQSVYKAREPIEIEIQSNEEVHLGIFAWCADNRVVRLYPRKRDGLRMGAGERLTLPKHGELRIMSAPMFGNREDQEAFVVVAVTSPIDFATLAPTTREIFSTTTNRPTEGADFLNALAGKKPTHMKLVWLPYLVRERLEKETKDRSFTPTMPCGLAGPARIATSDG